MPRVEDIKVRLSVIDNVSPALRRLRFGFWLAAHPTAVIVTALVLVGLLGLTTGIAVVLWAFR